MPATTLMQLGMKYLNYLDLKARLMEEQANAERQMPVLELIANQDLEDDRRKEILDEYIATLNDDLVKATEAREAIQ